MTSTGWLPPLPLPDGVTSRQVHTGPTGLSFHILEAGFAPGKERPLIVLLHGFPEIAFSWRKVMPLLADAGYYVVAPDLRGYGRTTGWDTRDYSNLDLRDFTGLNLVRDILLLVHSVGYSSVRCIVGHDFGAVPASLCALIRPDFFHGLVLLSHPFKGSPNFVDALDATKTRGSGSTSTKDIHADLAALGRKHYKWYYSTPRAHADMAYPRQGLAAFLRGYYHLKSASCSENDAKPLDAWSATELAKMPHYYIMPLDATMPEAVALDMAREPDAAMQDCKNWLPDTELDVYVGEYARTGFQGSLNSYRLYTDPPPEQLRFLDLLAGKKIEVPCAFISGRQDWGTFQEPGVIEKMKSGELCTDFRGVTLVDGAGHWVPQEKPRETANGILELVRGLR